MTSDCDAIQNVYLPHEWSATREQAVADSLVAGTDLDCGTYMQEHLPGAFKQGLVNETVLDQALIRQYSSLVRLGWFDSADSQPYRQLGWDAVATNASQALARKAATEGIVLLKNNGVLPLAIDSSVSLGVFGDWANASSQLLGTMSKRKFKITINKDRELCRCSHISTLSALGITTTQFHHQLRWR